MYCNNCDISEEEDSSVSYEEFVDKHLCSDCLHDEERGWTERMEFERHLKEQNQRQPEKEIDYTGIRKFPIL